MKKEFKMNCDFLKGDYIKVTERRRDYIIDIYEEDSKNRIMLSKEKILILADKIKEMVGK